MSSGLQEIASAARQQQPCSHTRFAETPAPAATRPPGQCNHPLVAPQTTFSTPQHQQPTPKTPQAWYTIEQMSGYYTGNPQAVLSNKNALANLLMYHVLDGKALRAGQLKEGQVLKMMNGEPVTVHVSKA